MQGRDGGLSRARFLGWLFLLATTHPKYGELFISFSSSGVGDDWPLWEESIKMTISVYFVFGFFKSIQWFSCFFFIKTLF